MIQEPFVITLILLAVVVIATKWAERFQHSNLMRILPTPVWCYIPPTILTTMGILPMGSVVYEWISRYVLPACLVLLLMTTDLQGLKQIGRSALIAMASASSAVIIGTICTFFLFQSKIGPETWKVLGTLTASWIGGTANMLAVKQAVGLQDILFVPLFISDITTVYIWMTFLMILSGSQEKINRFLHADHTDLNKLIKHQQKTAQTHAQKLNMKSLVLLLFTGFGFGLISTWVGERMPEIGMAISRGTWIIILVTTCGLWLSFTSYARQEGPRATKVGYFLLYWVLASTGAKANLLAILKAPLFLGMAIVLACIHGVLLLTLGRIFRTPIALLATASQANLGGVASAPIVASTYEPKLVPVALILAILGNAIANYLAILTAYLLHAFGGY